MLVEYQVQTYTGMTIFRCAHYEPDEVSPNYVPREVREPDVIMVEQMAAAQLDADRLIAELTEAGSGIWQSSSNSSATQERDRPTRPWPKKLGKSTGSLPKT
jgi:hypothetical protein